MGDLSTGAFDFNLVAGRHFTKYTMAVATKPTTITIRMPMIMKIQFVTASTGLASIRITGAPKA